MEQWTLTLTKLFEQGKAFTQREVRDYFQRIAKSFAQIPIRRREKTKVGIVGEIYVKYSALANNHLEDFLFSQGCEVMVPGILGFMIFKVDNRLEDIKLYGGNEAKKTGVHPAEVVFYQVRERPDRRGEEIPLSSPPPPPTPT